ncbi:MAG: hypothetical protein Q9218_001661 [Villophora microphyllina]
MSFAPPVSRDGFHFNGDLYVETGNFNRHKRASVPEITAILRPDLKETKAGASAEPPRDQVAHWYEAQLIHYGLQPSKDKARAKMRLLDALNNAKLNVPANIVKLEADLKKEYAAAERKAKAQYKASLAATAQSESPANAKKRKQPESTNNINVNINFGNHGFPQFLDVPYTTNNRFAVDDPESGPKKRVKKSTDPALKNVGKGRKDNADGVASTITPKKPTVRKSKVPSLPVHGHPAPFSWPTDSPLRTGSTLDDADIAAQVALAEKFAPVKKGSSAKQRTNAIIDDTAKPVPKAKAGKPVKKEQPMDENTLVKKTSAQKKTPAVKNEPATKKEATIKTEPIVKKESTTKKEPAMKKRPRVQAEQGPSSNPKLGLINGHYDITCPNLEYLHPDHGQTLSLTLCLDSPHVWGAYDLGMFSGILRIGSRPFEASPDYLPCRYRGIDEGSGEVEFGDHCTGAIAFLGNGRIEGWLQLNGECHFQGVRRPGPGTAPRNAASMKAEWYSYNETTQ